MFKIVADPTFWTKVQLSLPGGEKKGEIEIQFKYLKPQDYLDWVDASTDLPVRDALEEMILDWKGAVDDQGKAVPYNKDALFNLLDEYHMAETEIIQAWQFGLRGARIKN